MLLERLHHDPDEVKHTQQFTESLVAENALPPHLLKYAQDIAMHCTGLHTQTHTEI